ncbi:MAG: class I SAM-dependent methyltransferase [Thiotrichales bacterium]|nr:class I SAM-dependent methyltransferase [Thiotrichales bacterium]
MRYRRQALLRAGVKNTLQGFGEHLPFPDNNFDFITMGYALRHVTDLNLLFSEYHRVLKPGGKILLLEITQPQHPFRRAMVKLYLKRVIPTITLVFLGSAKAQRLMQYYWETIENCVPPKTILSPMELTGLSTVNRYVEQGIFSEYTGIKE